MIFTHSKKFIRTLSCGSALMAFAAMPYFVAVDARASENIKANKAAFAVALPRPNPDRLVTTSNNNVDFSGVEAASTSDVDVMAAVLGEITKLRELINAERADREILRAELEKARQQVSDLKAQLAAVNASVKTEERVAAADPKPAIEKKAAPKSSPAANVEVVEAKKDAISSVIDDVPAPTNPSDIVQEIKPTAAAISKQAAKVDDAATVASEKEADVAAQDADKAILDQAISAEVKSEAVETETKKPVSTAVKSAAAAAKKIALSISKAKPVDPTSAPTDQAKAEPVEKIEKPVEVVEKKTAVTKEVEKPTAVALAPADAVTTLPLKDEAATESDNPLGVVASADPVSLLPAPRENPRPRILPEIPKGPLYIKLPIKNDTYDVVVLGDSLGSGLWQGMHQNFRGEVNPALKITKLAKANTGIVRSDRFDWMRRTEQAAARSGAQIAVLMFGANDAQTIREGGKRHHLKTPGWEKLYRQRIDRIITALKRKKIAIYWVGLPNVRIPSLRRNYLHFNAIFREKAAEHGIKFVDTWNVSNDSAGQYQASGRALNGRIVKLRAKDGTHFTSAGYRLLASFLDKTLKADLQASRTAKLARSYKLRRSGG